MAGAAEPPPDISGVDLVMRNIFQYLDERDLRSCVQAFDYWERDIQIEIQNRQDVYPFLWTWSCKEHGEIDGCNKEQEIPRSIHDDIRLKVGKYSSRRCVPLLFCTDSVVEDAEILFPGIQPTVITDEYRRWLKSKDLVGSPSKSVKRVICALRQLVIKALSGYFPCSPEIILSSETELMMGCGEDSDLTDLSSMSHAIAGFILPQYPGFEIRHFEIPTRNDFSLIPHDANIKGLLMFLERDGSLSKVVDFVQHRRNYEIAIGGYNLSTCGGRDGSIVAFCGENVETASLVVSEYDRRPQMKLSLFLETTLVRNKCFAFVFNCYEVEKFNRLLHEKSKNRLATMFRQLYPDIPLVGIRTYSTYGADYLPGVSDYIKNVYLNKLINERIPRYSFVSECVFVLVSIKP